MMLRGCDQFDAQSVATIAYSAALACLSEASTVWAKIAATSIPRLADFSDRQLANLLWAYAKIATTDGEAFVDAIDVDLQKRLPPLAPIDLSLITWSVAKLARGSEAFYREAAASSLSTGHNWSNSDARNIVTLLYAFVASEHAAEHDAVIQRLSTMSLSRLPEMVRLGEENIETMASFLP
eukprot:1916048-Amphidinium_carterae.1